MARFEVFIPATPPRLPIDVTLRVESENWLAALKTGMQKLGGAQLPPNILCDIQADGSIHVSDPDGRVFRIRELAEGPLTTPAPVPPAPAVAAPAPAPPATPARPAPPTPGPTAPTTPQTSKTLTLSREPVAPRAAPLSPAAPAPQAARPAAPPAPKPAAPAARPRPSSIPDRVVETKAPAPRPQLVARSVRSPRELKAEEVLTDLFLRVADLGSKRSRQEGLAFLLDLAMEKVGCEAGSVFLSRAGEGELAFAVIRGPKADEIMKLGLKVPVGVGIVGFCAQENVCLAVSDAEKDPRWYRRVSDAIGYATRSLLCAPISAEGRVLGALEVLNKSGKDPFDSSDLAVLSYLAHQAAEFLLRVEG